MLSTFATLYKRNHFSIARTFRTMTLIRSMLSSGRSRIWSHTCAMTASFALSTGCGSANSSASEMSSLCNALFGQDVCEISDVKSCTRNPQEVLLQMGGKKITLVDIPGVGENEDRDREYAQLYSKILPELDVALWVIKADDRAMSSDEAFFKQIVKPHVEQGKVFFFVINQCDKIEPFREWNESGHEPGPKQLQNIQRKVTDVATRFSVPESKIIPVSACEKYNLVRLIDEMVFAMPKDKKITIVNSAARENVSAQAQEDAKKGFFETVGEIIENAVDKGAEVIGKVIDVIDTAKDFIRDLFWWL